MINLLLTYHLSGCVCSDDKLLEQPLINSTCLGLGTTVPGSGSHCYYGDNRKKCKYPWDQRTLAQELKYISEVEDEDRVSHRSNLAKASGFTGLSALHRLHRLYQFDFIQDLVFDAMHNLPLNVVSKQLHRLIDSKTFNSKELDSRLQAIPWPPGKS